MMGQACIWMGLGFWKPERSISDMISAENGTRNGPFTHWHLGDFNKFYSSNFEANSKSVLVLSQSSSVLYLFCNNFIVNVLS